MNNLNLSKYELKNMSIIKNIEIPEVVNDTI